jgi:hypothetical protein
MVKPFGGGVTSVSKPDVLADNSSRLGLREALYDAGRAAVTAQCRPGNALAA